MNIKIKYISSVCISLILLLIYVSCQSSSNESSVFEEKDITKEAEPKWANEIEEVKAAVDHFLYVVGNYDLTAIQEITMPSANIGIVRWSDGVWVSSDITFEDYIERAGKRELIPYYEPPRTYNVEISEGQLAFVKADCILHRLGIARSHNVDFFMLIKHDGKWKMVNVSFTAKALPEEDQEFDLDIFARSYAQSWGSKRPDFLAMYFAEDGSLRVNEAEASVGREEIAELAQGFMTDLPDMVVRYDSLVNEPESIRFHWTLIATYSGPNGNGNKVNVSGYEEWQIENGLIKRSQGHFPTEEFNKQIGLQ